MRQIPEKEMDVFELELAIKWAHGAALMDTHAEVSYLFSLSEKALKEKLERLKGTPPSNAPLTPEQLLEMVGEPVWLGARGLNRWDIFSGGLRGGFACFLQAALPMKCYGKTWTAYRHKPDNPTYAE